MSSRVPFPGFVGSAFSAQSKRFDTQDLWNWYLERAHSQHAKAGQALLPCPGFTPFTTLPTGPVRGLFAQNDKAFAVSGDRFYQLSTNGRDYIERSLTVVSTPTKPVITTSPLTPEIGAPTVPVITHGGAVGTTTYGYKITAMNAFGETTGSPEGTSAVGNATLSGTNWNIVSWPAVQGCIGYRIYRTTAPTGTGGAVVVPRLIATVASTTLVVHDVGHLGDDRAVPTVNTTGQKVGNVTYKYRVSATLGLGESAASEEGVTFTGPTQLSSTNKVTVSWQPVVNARGYNVYRTVGGQSPPRLIAKIVAGEPGKALSIDDTGELGEAVIPPTENTTGTQGIADDGAPVTFASSGDAGEQLLFVSGNFAYCYDFESNVLAPVVKGASSGGFIDSYFVVLDATESALLVSESFDGFQWDPTQVYQRSRAGDKWLSMAVTSNNIWLIGTQTGEVWVGTGDTEARFAPYLPVFIEAGVIAADTMIRVSGDTMMWVAADKDGAGYVVKTNGYNPEKVSTAAVDHSIQNLHTIGDGAAFSYQQDGHTFYVVSFPAARTTWVYDLSTNEWHRRGYWDPKVREFTVYRPQCYAFAFGAIDGLGLNLVGDRVARDVMVNGELQHQGVIAKMHPRYGTDIDDAVIRRVRQCPHTGDRDQEVTFDRLQMDMDVGEGLAAGQGSDPTMMLVYSNDAGNTWGKELWRSAGKQGDFKIQVAWSRLGTAKHRVFRLVVSDPVPWRVVGAWLEMEGS